MLTFPLPRNSDDVTVPLAAKAIIHGNWRLRGWLLTENNYLTTDIALFACFRTVFGSWIGLLNVFQGLLWAAASLVAIHLAARDVTGRAALASVLAGFTLLVLAIHHDTPEVDALGILGSHASTILFGLVTFWLSVLVFEKIDWRLALMGILVILGVFADPMFEVFACLPLFLTCLLRTAVTAERRAAIFIIMTVIFGVSFSHILLRLNAATGGLKLLSLSFQFADFDSITTRVLFATHCMMKFMGADFTGRQLTPASIPMLLISLTRAPFLILLAGSIWHFGRSTLYALRRWPSSSDVPPESFLDQLLWISFMVTMSCVTLSNLLNFQADARYVIPGFTVGSILLIRHWRMSPLFAIHTLTAFFISIVLEVVWIADGPYQPVVTTEAQQRIIGALRDAGLVHGYAGYWDASILSAATSGKVTSLALATRPDHVLVAFHWDGDQNWYRTAACCWRGPVFFIASLRPQKPMDLLQDNVVKMMGQPERVIEVDDQLIDVYTATTSNLFKLLPEQDN